VATLFAPDHSADAVVSRCTPLLMNALGSSEKSFLVYLGEPEPVALYEYVLNLALVVPSILKNGKALFEDNIFPSTKRNLKFKQLWTEFYAPVLTLETPGNDNDVPSRFCRSYKKHVDKFLKINALARKALCRNDASMLEACAVFVAFTLLSDPVMSEELEQFTKRFISACALQ
jgi:hypothetical protein